MVGPILNRLPASPRSPTLILPLLPYLIGVKPHTRALKLLLPLMALFPLLAEIQRLQPDAKRHGLDINVTWCKM